MGFWNANSDMDWEAECNPRARVVERTCFRCERTFTMPVEGEYQLHVWCPRCLADYMMHGRFTGGR